MARKSSNRNTPSHSHDQEYQPESQSNKDTMNHVKVPIIDIKDVDPGNTDYPKVYEETNEDRPDSEEFTAPSVEYEAPNYNPPNSGEIFDEDSFQDIVKSVKIPNVRFSGKNSDTQIDPDLQEDKENESTPELPPELVNIKIPMSIPRSNIKHKKKSRKKKNRKAKIKKSKYVSDEPQVTIVKEKKKIKKINPVQQYTQETDNNSPKEEVIIIKPLKKKKPKPVFTSDDFDVEDFRPDFKPNFKVHQPRPNRIPVHHIVHSTSVKRKPKKVNVIIQNKKKRPILITHQNGDLIYWYPSKIAIPHTTRNYVCKRNRYNQCIIQKRPMSTLDTKQQYASLKFPSYLTQRTKSAPSQFDDDSFFLYKVVKKPKTGSHKIPSNVLKFGQSLFLNDHEENGSFFKEIDGQGEEEGGIDEPEAENNEAERITDEEVENDKTSTDDEDQGEDESKVVQPENENLYDDHQANDYN